LGQSGFGRGKNHEGNFNMFAKTFSIRRRCLTVCAVATLGLGLTTPVLAQPGYGDYSHDPETLSGVTVTAPRHTTRDAATGAPIEWASTSRVVRYDDLDLSRRWGVRELRVRIARAARSACDELDTTYPVDAPNNPPCVRNAIRNALADSPIADYVEAER
jgi:UrcA family protein